MSFELQISKKHPYDNNIKPIFIGDL